LASATSAKYPNHPRQSDTDTQRLVACTSKQYYREQIGRIASHMPCQGKPFKTKATTMLSSKQVADRALNFLFGLGEVGHYLARLVLAISTGLL